MIKYILRAFFIWTSFIILMSLGALGDNKIDSFTYFIYGCSLLYISYIFYQIK